MTFAHLFIVVLFVPNCRHLYVHAWVVVDFVGRIGKFIFGFTAAHLFQ